MKKTIAIALSLSSLFMAMQGVFAVDVSYRAYSANEVINTNKYADTDYVFTLDGTSYTLLDVSDDSASKFLVTANKKYGTRTVKPDSFTNPEDTSSLNYWLNNTFVLDRGFSETVYKYVNKSHVWTLDPAPNASSPIAEGTTFTAGITIPSVSELEAYGSIVGYGDLNDSFSTRTVLNAAGDNNVFVYQKGTSDINDTSWKLYARKAPSTGLRPIFYLNDRFFAEVALDLTQAGDMVKEEIKKTDIADLLNIYDVEYLMEQLDIAPPEGYIAIDNMTISTKSGESVKNGETLKAAFDYGVDNHYDMESAEFVWERIGGDETIELGTGDEYIVTEADTIGGQYTIRYKVTVTDTAGNSVERTSPQTAAIPAIVTKSYAPNYSINATRNTSNADYKFKVGDKTFVLVDTLNNDRSTFFVIPDYTFGTALINSAYFNPADSSNLAYTMNTTLPTSGLNGNTLPDEIIKHIDFEHSWACEAAPLNSNENVHKSYAYKAGISLLSFTELEKYSSIISTIASPEGYSRTAASFSNASGKNYINVVKLRDSGAFWANHWDVGARNSVLPIFYLDRAFFTDVKIDWTLVGQKAIEMIKKYYTVEDFNGMYSKATLEDLGFVHDYTVTANVQGLQGGEVKITGAVKSNIDAVQSGVAIFAVYDKNKATAAMKVINLLTAGKNDSQSFDISLGTLPEGEYSAKVMIWDNLYDANAKMSMIEL